MSINTKWTENETKFCEKYGFAGLVSNMEFSVFPADTARPEIMFCRIGLRLKDGIIGVSVEADQRLWEAWLQLPKCKPDHILSILKNTSIKDRQKMLEELDSLAERHELAWRQINAAEALIAVAKNDIL